MSAISIFAGIYCRGNDVAGEVAKALDYEVIGDQDLISQAGSRFSLPEKKFARAIVGKTSVFNRFTHERQRCVAYLRCILAEALKKDNRVYLGLAGHLIPGDISHVLRVCVTATTPYRIALGMQQNGLSEKQAAKSIHREDVGHTRWTAYLHQKHPWDISLYDMVVPLDEKSTDEVAALICSRLEKGVFEPNEASLTGVDDFVLTSQIEVALAKEGHDVSVSAKGGAVLLTINKHVMMLARLEEELKRVAGRIPGVSQVETTAGPGFYETDTYRQYDFRTPSKVLLVDDNEQFAGALSERLLMRDVGSTAVWDGEQALHFLEEEEPEVMVLDLEMPGIDGISVLSQVKKSHPGVEVIILTGQGSNKEKGICMALGAFAYLKKPVDIERLTDTLRLAYNRTGASFGNA